jgi:hypothetical protein
MDKTTRLYGLQIARQIYAEWRLLRNQTNEHELLCDCAKCSKRRRAGAQLKLPYAGPCFNPQLATND